MSCLLPLYYWCPLGARLVGVFDIEMNQMVKDLYVRHAHPCLSLYEISDAVYALRYFHGYAFSHMALPKMACISSYKALASARDTLSRMYLAVSFCGAALAVYV
jgi:hypothetical protein